MNEIEIEETERAFKEAEHHVKIDLTNSRLVPNAMEPRSYIKFEMERRYTLTTTQLHISPEYLYAQF